MINSGPVAAGPIRLADLYKLAAPHATRPLKVSVGAGPVNLAWHVYFQHYKGARDLSEALAPIFNAPGSVRNWGAWGSMIGPGILQKSNSNWSRLPPGPDSPPNAQSRTSKP